MWYSENERLGFKQCSPAAYALTVAAFILTLGGLVTILLSLWLTVKDILSHHFSAHALGPPLFSLGLLAMGWGCRKTAWALVRKKGFRYDYATDKSDWKGKQG
jgi:hypothetical protein